MDCLTCSQCQSSYQNSPTQKHLPRVLTTCGHTFCQKCIESKIQNSKITCFQCGKVSEALDISSLPLNETLIMLLKNHLQSQAYLCTIHKKKLQAYCQKQKELICLQCQLSTHRSHKVCLINAKAAMDRAVLKESYTKIVQNLQESNRVLSRLGMDESELESTYIDYEAQINMFYKNIVEEITKLQAKEMEKLQIEKNQIFGKITQYKGNISEKNIFLRDLQDIYKKLQASNDIQFIQRENQQIFIINSCKNKRQKYGVKTLQLKKVNYIQEIINSLTQMQQFQKKRMAHSSSNFQSNLKESNGNAVNNSPSLKKYSQSNREPAVLEVNLSEQYYKRKINLNRQPKKSVNQTTHQNPIKKVINITSQSQKDKDKLIESIPSGRSIYADQKSGKSQLKFIRESSIKRKDNNKDQQSQSSFFDQLDLSQNNTGFINSFMRTSREQQSINGINSDSSIKQSFNDFSLLQFQDYVYHFGGRINCQVQKYAVESGKAVKLGISFNKKHSQVIYNKNYSATKCLIVGGINNNQSQQNGTEIYQFNFKTQKLMKTGYSLLNTRISFGSISKEQSFYIFGGRNDKVLLNTFEKYTIIGVNKMLCEKMPNMNQYREDLGYCMGYDGCLYAAGGVNNNKSYLNSCERFNWSKFVWESIAGMKNPRRAFTLIPVPHGIFAIGGHSSQKVLSQVQLYDFNKGKWIQLTPLIEARCFHSAIVSKDYKNITVFGGFNNNSSSQLNQIDSIEIYEIESNTWRSGGKMQYKRGLHASIVSPS